MSARSDTRPEAAVSGLAGLEERLSDLVVRMRAKQKEIVQQHGERRLSEVSVAQAYGGARGVKCLVTETSAVDPLEGIRFRGYSIPQLQELLPKAPRGEEPLPEGVFWLLLTGEVPVPEDTAAVTAAWRECEALPAHVARVLDDLPGDTHPMTQLSIGIMALQTTSLFARRYREGLAKTEHWGVMFRDVVRLLGVLPTLAAYIYRRSYKRGVHIPPAEGTLDWAGNLAHMLGVPGEQFRELMRLYLSIHADHEGGNVSAHTTHLVGSALADPYLSLAAGMNGLAGPLHGLAAQEVVRWIVDLKQQLGPAPSRQALESFIQATLDGGKVVPGYGHAVLRRTDPRYTAQRDFALRHFPDDENVKILAQLYEIVPPILERTGKVKNPWPNVDAHSGCLFVHYGVVESDFYTVLFGLSRAIGVLSSLVWDRALMLPIERPKSVTSDWIAREMAGAATS